MCRSNSSGCASLTPLCICALQSTDAFQQVAASSPQIEPLALDAEASNEEGPPLSEVRQLGVVLSERIDRVEQKVETKMEMVLTALQEVTAKVDRLSTNA